MVIFVPPEPPTAIFTFPFWSNMRVGHMEDKGLFPLKENVCEVSVSSLGLGGPKNSTILVGIYKSLSRSSEGGK